MIYYCITCQGSYPQGCEAFRNVSPNIVPDENVMKNDEGLVNEQRYATVSIKCF